MTVSHNPTTQRQPASRGAQGHGENGKRVDLNAAKQAPAIRSKRKRA